MGSVRWLLAGLLLAGTTLPTSGQDAEPPVAGDVSDQEPLLPEVLVRPDQQPVVDEAIPGPASPFDLPMNYPAPSQIQFDGFDSALRSSRSMFHDPREVTVVTPQDLAERNPINMIQALEREVGVVMQRTGAGQTSPFIRGLTGPQTLILIDGIRLNNSTFRFGPNQYFGTIDPGLIERIEVMRGPQSVLWGSDAIGGVINVVTRSPDTRFSNYREGRFIERFDTADTGTYSRVNIEGSYDRWGLFGGASYLSVDNLDRGGHLGRQPFTDYDQYAGDIKFDYLIDATQMLTVAIEHFCQKNVPRTDKWPGESRRFDPQMRDLGYIRWQGTSWQNILFDTFMLTASYQRQEEGTDKRKPPDSTNEEWSNFDCGTTGANLVFARDLDFAGRLTYGADWYHDEVDAVKRRYDLTGVLPPETLTPQFPNDSYYERFGAFLQWEVDVTERLSAVSGVRYSHVNLGATVDMFDVHDPRFPNVDPVPTPIAPAFQDWTGSVGLTYRLNPCCHLVGSISEGFRAPLLDELTSVSDNVNEGVDLPPTGRLSPETSINYEVGMKFDYQRLRGQMFVYWTDLDGLIDRVLVAHDPVENINFFQRENVGTARLQGVELSGELLLTSEWSTYGNFSYTYGQNVAASEPVSRIPPVQGVIGLRWRDREGRNWFKVYGWLVARQDRLSERDERDSRIPPGGTPGFGTVSVFFGKAIGERQRLTLGIENIFDKAYRVHGSGVDGPGISGTLGYELVY